MSDRFAATWGVYPMLSESPMMSTFFSVEDGLTGAPGLQGHLLVTLGAPTASQLYTLA
jgi:hypothetical protein